MDNNQKKQDELNEKNEELKNQQEQKEREKEIERQKEEFARKFIDEFNKKNNQRKKGGRFNLKGIITVVFIVTVILSFPTFLSESEKEANKTISYTKFINYLKQNKFEKINERDGYVYGYEQSGVVKARMITSRLGEDQQLLSLIDEKNVVIESLPPQQMPFILNLLISWFPMLLLVAVWVFMLNKMNKGGGGGPSIFNMGKSRAKENDENTPKVTFDDVAGIDEAKVELKEVVDFLKEPEKYRKIGAKIPKGVLLLGSPGTGKTLLAKAVAGEAGVPFFSISGSEFVEMFVGVGASRVRDLFTKARKNSPCIIFIDEIDAVGRKRGTGQGGGNDEREQTLNQLLVEMDGFGSDETIIVIAATNRAEILDRALTRPGRFDRQVVVDRPDLKGREEILKVHAKNKKISKDIDFKVIARKTPGFVGADLANLLNEAAILAARDNRDEITMVDLEEASEKVSIGPERKSRMATEKERLIVAYHEVGHAITRKYLSDAEIVHKITIIPRGVGALGYTMSLPTEDKYLETKTEYINKMVTLLGGRAAEEIVFGDITTGASNDIERATAIAHAMITKFGMCDRFGPVMLDATKEGDMFQHKLYGEETANQIDKEVFSLINTTYEKAKSIIIENREGFERVTQALLKLETITGEEFNALLEGKEIGRLKEEEEKAETVDIEAPIVEIE